MNLLYVTYYPKSDATKPTGIQFISSWTLFYASRIRCPLNNLQILLYLDSSVTHWNDTIIGINQK
ncbi:hypothetical protein OZD61_02245 [Wolbachia endosymbiont of Drosophila bocki]|uniref:hypothetical protein n=1 Tax=unclassified Wolbachia TaxID=2640676 RepID=UPI0023A9ED76|nr:MULTISPECIES: hypothetical protein [unclassified Wolbachia]MDE5057612.1 hypothetical protein [Wolbachia endosymbiont of Drosophila bocki]MDE5067015.1 hypothetical protein [Wolbachia endosymbiont of Drosophila leontia]